MFDQKNVDGRFLAAMLSSSAVVALWGGFQCHDEETNRKLLFVSTRRLRPFRQGSDEEHGTESKLMAEILVN